MSSTSSARTSSDVLYKDKPSNRLSRRVSKVSHFFAYCRKPGVLSHSRTSSKSLSVESFTDDFLQKLNIGEPQSQSTSAMISHEELLDLKKENFSGKLQSTGESPDPHKDHACNPSIGDPKEPSTATSESDDHTSVRSKKGSIHESEKPHGSQELPLNNASTASFSTALLENCLRSKSSLALCSRESKESATISDFPPKSELSDSFSDKFTLVGSESLEGEDFVFENYTNRQSRAFYESHSLNTGASASPGTEMAEQISHRESPEYLPSESPKPPSRALLKGDIDAAAMSSAEDLDIRPLQRYSDMVTPVQKSFCRSKYQSGCSARTISSWRPERLISRASHRRPEPSGTPKEPCCRVMSDDTIKEMRTLRLDAHSSCTSGCSSNGSKIKGLPRLSPVQAAADSK